MVLSCFPYSSWSYSLSNEHRVLLFLKIPDRKESRSVANVLRPQRCVTIVLPFQYSGITNAREKATASANVTEQD
jgi:hypothetical protein